MKSNSTFFGKKKKLPTIYINGTQHKNLSKMASLSSKRNLYDRFKKVFAKILR